MFLKFKSTKLNVKDFIKIMDNNNEQGQINKLCNLNVFLFIYNVIADTNLNPKVDKKNFKKVDILLSSLLHMQLAFVSKKIPVGS